MDVTREQDSVDLVVVFRDLFRYHRYSICFFVGEGVGLYEDDPGGSGAIAVIDRFGVTSVFARLFRRVPAVLTVFRVVAVRAADVIIIRDDFR